MNRICLSLFETNQHLSRQLKQNIINANQIKLVQFFTSNSLEKKNSLLKKCSNESGLHQSQFSTSFNQDKWSKILKKAEKVVGYPTSFLNLRYLVSDEVAHFAQLLR